MKTTRHLFALLSCSLFAFACQSSQNGIRDARDFWEGDDGQWASEVVISALESMSGASAGGADDEPRQKMRKVDTAPFLAIKRVTASFEEGSASTGGMAPMRLVSHENGQVQFFSLDPHNRNQVVYSIYVFDEREDGLRVPIGTELWTFRLDGEKRSPAKLNLPGPNFRLNPILAEDGFIYLTTDEFGGLEMARMNMAGRQFQRLHLPGNALAADLLHGRILYNAAIESGVTEVRVVEASNRDRTSTICVGTQPRWGAEKDAVFFVEEGSIWRTTTEDHNTHERVLNRPEAVDDRARGAGLSLKDPALSPDGRLIAYASNETQVGGRYNYDIFVAGSDGSDPQRITHLESHDDMPQWSDDQTLIYRSNRGRQWGLWQIRVDRLASEEPTAAAR